MQHNGFGGPVTTTGRVHWGARLARGWRSGALAVLVLCLTAAVSQAQPAGRDVTFMSAGVRVAGTVFQPEAGSGERLPAIVMAHGWGGTAAMLHASAARLAEAGYFVLVFDYRGWGRSDGRLVREPSGDTRELREVIDPIDQATDFFNAVHWVMGEAAVDPARVGLWGTSFSGGLVVYVAARDPRIRAVVSQVAWFGQSRDTPAVGALAAAKRDATRRARGEIGYPEPGAREVGNLYGAPVRESFLLYAPVDDVPRLGTCAVLILDAEKEELFDIREHGQRVFEGAPGPRKRVVLPGITHYGVYGEMREQALQLAIEWMDANLKPRR